MCKNALKILTRILLIINTLTHGITDETTRLVGVGAARKGVQEIGQARGHIVIVLRRHYDVSVGLFHELFVFDQNCRGSFPFGTIKMYWLGY